MIFTKVSIPKTMESPDDLVKSNIDVLNGCKKSGKRYRIRRGVLGNRSVVVIQEVRSFIDKLFSYLPSFRSLKNRLAKDTLSEMGTSGELRNKVAELLARGGSIPGISNNALKEAYCPKEIYNPWHGILPDRLDSKQFNQNGSMAQHDSLPSNGQIGFYDKGAAHEIFSNMHLQKEGEKLCFIDFPGYVSTAACTEVLYQAGKYYSKPEIREEILKKTYGTDAISIGHPMSSGANPDRDFFVFGQGNEEAGRDLILMLKIVRTRAQQESEFRKQLVGTGDELIFEVTPGDMKWGVVFDKEDKSYKGKNYFGRILMQVRQEINNSLLPEVSASDVRASKGIVREVPEEAETTSYDEPFPPL